MHRGCLDSHRSEGRLPEAPAGQPTVIARIVAKNHRWDAVRKVTKSERTEFRIPGCGTEVRLDRGLILVYVGRELVPVGGVGNGRAEPEPSVLVIVPSVHEVTGILTGYDWSGGKHHRAAIGSIDDVPAEAHVATLEAVQEFKYACATLSARGPWGVIHSTDSPWL